ncbi:lipoprotein-releasing ABC transporter permease subunit [Pseudoalteromonas fenneropenaei]|uniref:Lipoprotein-releasing ABC transporter permease subunit n=1 Tax=Pseudoalteromonas fenneropenaei TaxID=1737459 RepID=A0ABV7CFA0_9GAMM
MFQPVSLFVGLRYSRSGKGNAFISFISFFSIAGIALGLTALITVNSVMNGFEQNLKGSMLALIPHVQISGEPANLAAFAETLQDNPLVRQVGPHLAGEAVLQTNRQLQGVMLQGGVSSDTSLTRFIQQGSWQELSEIPFSIGISRYLATQLNVGIGDQIRVIIPQVSNYTPMGRVPVQRLFEVRVLFSTESEADLHLAYTNFSSLSKLLRLRDDTPTTYSIMLHDAFNAALFQSQYQTELAEFKVSDWRSEQGALFAAVAMEKRIMTLMLALIVLVAVFNILSALSMMVNEKIAEIAILQTLGFTPARISQVFMVQGIYNGVIGTVCGLAGGLLLAHYINEALTLAGLDLLGGMRLPVLIEPMSIAMMACVSLGLSFLATLFPARKAAKVLPAEVLRYE